MATFDLETLELNKGKSYNHYIVGKSGGKSGYTEQLKAQGYEVTEIPLNVISRPAITEDTKFFQVKKGLSIHEYLLKDVMDDLHDYSGISFTMEQTLELLTEFDRLEELIDRDDFNTDLRDSLMSTLSEKLIGKSWPINGDSEEKITAFYQKLYLAAEKAGYEVWDLEYKQ